MIRVHLNHEISMSPLTFDADSWIYDAERLEVRRGGEALALFTPGSWAFVEDLSMTEPKSDAAA